MSTMPPIYVKPYHMGDPAINVASLDANNAAYRTLYVPVQSGQPDTQLFALPGHEKELAAIAKEMAKVAKQRWTRPKWDKGKKKVPGLRALPKIAVTPGELLASLAPIMPKGRYTMNGLIIANKGRDAVATDGYRIHMIRLKRGTTWGDEGTYILNDGFDPKTGELGKPGEESKPPYDNIVANFKSLPADEIFTIYPETLIPQLRKLLAIFENDSKVVLVSRNPSGGIGLAAMTSAGQAEINFSENGTDLGGMNPEFLLEAMEFLMRAAGDAPVKAHWPAPNRPLQMMAKRGEDVIQAVIMPVNVEGHSTKQIHRLIEGGAPGGSEELRPASNC